MPCAFESSNVIMGEDTGDMDVKGQKFYLELQKKDLKGFLITSLTFHPII